MTAPRNLSGLKRSMKRTLGKRKRTNRAPDIKATNTLRTRTYSTYHKG